MILVTNDTIEMKATESKDNKGTDKAALITERSCYSCLAPFIPKTNEDWDKFCSYHCAKVKYGL